MYFTSANVLQVFACKLFVAFTDIYVESLKGQQPKQGNPNLPLPRHLLQFF